MFEKKVDMRSRKKMIDFLTNHYRYNTMNSWNRSTSYANNVKIYNLNIPREYQDKAWEILDVIDYDDLCWLAFYEFKTKTGYDIGFNGRSGGYIVMYDTDWNYENGKRVLRTYPGRSIDSDDEEYFEEYDLNWLRERVKLVQEFDRTCDIIRDKFIRYLTDFDIEDEEYTVTKTRKVLVER